MKVLVISDTHFPYQDKRAMKKVISIARKEKPGVIIQIGDLLDQYSFSRYSRNPNFTSPEKEIKTGLKYASAMWKDLRKACPKAKCIQVMGNHDLRLRKRIMEVLPEVEGLVDHKSLYTYSGVKTLKSDRDYVKFDGVVYCHGWLSRSLDHAKHFFAPTVHGHRHKPAIETAGRLWSMDVGFLGNEKTMPFNYTMSKFTGWKMAIGIVDNGQPRLVFL